MDVTISGSVGKGVSSSQADLIKVEGLLAAVGVYKMETVPAPAPSSSKTQCPDDVVSAIKEFQGFWGSSDGRVDPNGTTLHRLNRVAHPLQLQAIKRKPMQSGISKGGYEVRYTGHLPPDGYSLFLHIDVMPPGVKPGETLSDDQQDHCLDLTDRMTQNSDLLNFDKLKGLLKVLDEQDLWGIKALAALIVERDGVVISVSNVQPIDCPVQPFEGELKDNLGDDALGEDDAPTLLYTGNLDGSGGGAIAYIPAIDGKYYFYYSEGFEIKNSRRGFDCTTFAGAVLGISGNSGAMGGNGTDFAAYLVQKGKACGCDLDDADDEDVHEFFAMHPTGSYFAWSGGHVILIKDAVVHEFTLAHDGKPAGYFHTDIDDREFKGHWNLRKLTPAL